MLFRSLVHVEDSVQHGRLTAGAARTVALTAIDRWCEPARRIADSRIRSQIAAASTAHETTVARLIDRERSLITVANGKATPAQPGLFDNGGIRRHENSEPSVLMEQHERRLETLTRSIPLESRCDLIGILIVTKSNGVA